MAQFTPKRWSRFPYHPPDAQPIQAKSGRGNRNDAIRIGNTVVVEIAVVVQIRRIRRGQHVTKRNQ